jgi:hypothetical protein
MGVAAESPSTISLRALDPVATNDWMIGAV